MRILIFNFFKLINSNTYSHIINQQILKKLILIYNLTIELIIRMKCLFSAFSMWLSYIQNDLIKITMPLDMNKLIFALIIRCIVLFKFFFLFFFLGLFCFLFFFFDWDLFKLNKLILYKENSMNLIRFNIILLIIF